MRHLRIRNYAHQQIANRVLFDILGKCNLASVYLSCRFTLARYLYHPTQINLWTMHKLTIRDVGHLPALVASALERNGYKIVQFRLLSVATIALLVIRERSIYRVDFPIVACLMSLHFHFTETNFLYSDLPNILFI